MKSISVIVPTHLGLSETSSLLNECINQLGREDELIIVVDNPNISDDYELYKCNNIQVVINLFNIGAARSRNKGIDVATKDLILFIDSTSFQSYL